MILSRRVRVDNRSMPPSTLKKSFRAIERALAEIEKRFAAMTVRERIVERENARRIKALMNQGKPRRKLKITPKRRAQLKLQGVYMTYMRQLGPRQKARVRAVKEKRGFQAAIATARKLARRTE
jgi:hypothetical protein